MKNVLKILIKSFLKFFVYSLSKIRLGRYILDKLHINITEKKKVIFYKDLKLEFYVPNRLSYYRVNTFSTKEPETLNWIDGFGEKTVFWDIVANIGLYSFYAAKKKQCKIYAFEPSIFNLEWLGRNIQLNDLVEKIVVISVPLTETISENMLNFSSTEWSGALTTFGQNYPHDGKKLKKKFGFSTIGISIDDAKNLMKIPQPDYIKVDVDGIEHLILKGGREVLSNTKELLVEVNEKFEKHNKDCFETLRDLGFILKEKKHSDLFEKTDFAHSYNQIWIKQ